MEVGRKITKYNVSLTDKDIDILIECLQKSKLDNFRHQNHAESLLEEFIKIFLDDNRDKYINRYLSEVEMFLEHNYKLDSDQVVSMAEQTKERINDDYKYVFHYDSEDWAKRLVEGYECDSDDRDYEAEIIADVMRKPSDKVIERNKRCSKLLKKLRS